MKTGIATLTSIATKIHARGKVVLFAFCAETIKIIRRVKYSQYNASDRPVKNGAK